MAKKEIRRAAPDDAERILAVKESVSLNSPEAGFLISGSVEDYRQLIGIANGWVLVDNEVQGFAFVFPDEAFRASATWELRDFVQWEINPEEFYRSNLAFFDQLALAPGTVRRWAAPLAFTALADAMNQGCDHLLTSTITKPVSNETAVPYIKRLGGNLIGTVDEEDPEVGRLISHIWMINRPDYLARIGGKKTPAETWVVDQAHAALGLST